MNCVETKNKIEALLDGELDEIEKDAIEHHLWICPSCLELKERTAAFSCLLQSAVILEPSARLDERVFKSFKNHHVSQTFWQRTIFGIFAIPKPIFAAFLFITLVASWAAFQIGKLSSTDVSMTSPQLESNINPASITETKIQTVTVEVPVIREKTVTRVVYIRENKNPKKEKEKFIIPAQNNSPLFSSTVADNGFYTDVSLKGFEPSAEISAKIIKEVKPKEVKENEK